MDRRLLGHYERELRYLRGLAGEFAKAYPKIAGRLALDSVACEDPYVERLLEGFAFLAARVQLKLEAEFPRFTQALLETVYPGYLAPTPSMLVAQLQPEMGDSALAEGFVAPRGTLLRASAARGDLTACEYVTAHDATLWPVEIAEAQYHTRDLEVLAPPQSLEAKAAIRLRLRTAGQMPFKELKMDKLVLFLAGSDETPMRIYEQLFAQSAGVMVCAAQRPVKAQTHLPASSIRQVGFSDEEKLLPFGTRSFQGYRLLQEYFAFPQRFLFVELAGLEGAWAALEGTEAEVAVFLKKPCLELERVLDASCFHLHCTPAINLFHKTADRIQVTERFSEFPVIPNRTRPLDYEVYQVTSVAGMGDRGGEERAFRPFYSAKDLDAPAAEGAYYTAYRTPRMLTEREHRIGPRSTTYLGSDLTLSIVDARAAPYSPDLRQLRVETLCTNRDLPLRMPLGRGQTDFTLETSAPVQAVRCVAGPTPPRPSRAEGEFSWRLVSHLSLNYLSLADAEGGGVQALRDILKLYGDTSDPSVARQIEGVKGVEVRPMTLRVPTPGPIAFARGLEIELTLEESAFYGTGFFLLGAVLERFFAKYASINSFTETVVRTIERGEAVMRWPAKMGQRPIL